MAKKGLISIITIIFLFLTCNVCFAEENNNSINLGNEIMQSVDKTGKSAQNVISGNVIQDAGNMVKDGMQNVGNMAEDMVNGDNQTDGQNYNVVRTEAQGMQNNNGFGTMTTTTWMWIILVVAAVVVMAAVWYYVAQGTND